MQIPGAFISFIANCYRLKAGRIANVDGAKVQRLWFDANASSGDCTQHMIVVNLSVDLDRNNRVQQGHFSVTISHIRRYTQSGAHLHATFQNVYLKSLLQNSNYDRDASYGRRIITYAYRWIFLLKNSAGGS